jgi:hypothetical protein
MIISALRTFLLIIIPLLGSLRDAAADSVSAEHAGAAVRGWLKDGRLPLEKTVGQRPKRVETFKDAGGEPLYYVIDLDPQGFVIVAADDLIEPIVGFAPSGRFDPSIDNPLGALVRHDLRDRMAKVRGMQAARAQGPHLTARNKWAKLKLGAANVPQGGDSQLVYGPASISDVWVAPLIQTLWSQTTVAGGACYNYYTPPNAEGSAANYYSGCTATAMAQLMRYWQFPVVGVGTASFWISISGVTQSRSLRGGNGTGGPYVWTNMVLDPGSASTLDQRKAIGALCHDAGVAALMAYASDGSGAAISDAAEALVNTFGYANAVCVYDGTDTMPVGLYDMVNPNLDAGCPVVLSIWGPPGGHAVVCDGYGYSNSTLYHHLNLGWGGNSNAWYALPIIDTSSGGTYTSVHDVLYNVWTTGTGEIISGHVTNSGGTPVTGAVVTATRVGGGTYTATSNANGIYAFAKIPSSSQYVVSAHKTGCFFEDRSATTGKSTKFSSTSGNQWGIDFLNTAPTAPAITTSSPLASGTRGMAYNQILTASGGKMPYTWTLNSGNLPSGLSLSNTGVISGMPDVAMTASFIVRVTGNNGMYSTKTLSLAIIATTPAITTSSPLPSGVRGVAYNQTLEANGGTTPYNWTLAGGSLPTGLSLSAAGVISGTPGAVTSASFTIKVTANNGLFATKAFGLAISPSISDAMDQTALVFTSSGNLPWSPQTTSTHDGVDAAQCGAITHDQTSVMQTTVTGPGVFSFWWKVSSESDCDYLTFHIDDVQQSGAISGNVNWQQKSYTLKAGSHTLKWIYSKDDSINSGSDCGWVDQLTLPAATPEPYTYTTTNGTITITGYTGSDSTATIPGTINSMPVTRIGDWSFAYCANLTRVILPNSVTSIGDAAFAACTRLTSVQIPGGVTSIGISAFASCTSLARVTLPGSLTSIGNAAFSWCASLTGVTIPNSVTAIGDLAFASCGGLTSASFTGNAPWMGADVFGAAASGFTVYYFNDKTDFTSPTWYGYVAVSMNPALPPWVTTGAASGITMTSATLDGTLNPGALASTALFEYGPTAAYGSTVGAAISPPHGTGAPTVSASISGLQAGTIYHYRLTATAGSGTITGGDMTFAAAAVEPFTYTLANGMITITGYSGSGGALVIPSSIGGMTVSGIGDAAFHNRGSLTSVTIPNSVTNIGASAFQSCTSLTRVTIPGSVTHLGDWALGNCSNLRSAIFMGNAPSMGTSVFDAAAGVFTVYYHIDKSGFASPVWSGYPAVSMGPMLPPGVTAGSASRITATTTTLQGTVNPYGLPSTAWFEYGPTAAYGGMASVTLSPDNAVGAQSVSAVISGLQPATIYHYRLTALNGIGTNAGVDMTFTTGVTVPYTYIMTNGLITITGYTGSGGALVIPSSIGGKIVTGIGDWAFAGCGLTSVTIPASITSIGAQAFSYCFSLTSANFMGNAPLTGASVFDYVGSGFTVYYSTDKADFTSPTWMGYPAVGVEPLHLPAGYMSWIAGYFPGEIDPAIINTTADPDRDGLRNAVEMVLGGNPATVMDGALLPTCELRNTNLGTGAANYFLFSYRRTALSVATGITSGAQYSPNLVEPWTNAIDGVGGVKVLENPGFYGTGIDRVQVFIPRGVNPRIFGRLRVIAP